MKNDMVKIYDTVKSSCKNVHITVTFQLNANSSKMRYFTQDNIGGSKGISEVASTILMLRPLYEDEYEGGKNALQLFKVEGKSKIGFYAKRDKRYQLVFITKNREGASNDKQYVLEVDLSRNTYKEIGFTYCDVDF